MKRFFLYLSILALFSLAGGRSAFGHGSEDHGDEKPKTVATNKGSVSHISRLGAYEVMFKHQALEPDTAAAGRIFVTKYESNEPADDSALAIEFEAASGAVTAAIVEKTDAAGSFNVKIPALSEGTYVVRAKLTYAGETDTATFSSVEIKTAEVETGAGEMSWARTSLTGFVFALVLAMFGALVFFVWRFAAGDEPSTINRETISA